MAMQLACAFSILTSLCFSCKAHLLRGKGSHLLPCLQLESMVWSSVRRTYVLGYTAETNYCAPPHLYGLIQ